MISNNIYCISIKFIFYFSFCALKSISYFYVIYLFFLVNASQAGAGNLEIIVSVNGCNVPNYVQSEGNAKFRVNFKPREAAPHNLSVRFNGEPIPGSAFLNINFFLIILNVQIYFQYSCCNLFTL